MRTSGAYLLTSSDRDAVEELRFATLTTDDGGFVASKEAVQWSDSDDRSRILGVYSGEGVLLSSMRVELLRSPEELPPKLDYDCLHEVVSLPCGLLGKASTRVEHRGRGFNTYLRYLAYQEFRRFGVRYVVGTLMPGAPRLRLLQSLGYQFIENPEGWRRFGYQSFGKTLVCYVDLQANYDRIMSVLEPKLVKLKSEYPYVQT